jgi:hypothetical protein
VRCFDPFNHLKIHIPYHWLAAFHLELLQFHMEIYQAIKRFKDKKTIDSCRNINIWFSSVTLYQSKSLNNHVGERYLSPQDRFWWDEGQV